MKRMRGHELPIRARGRRRGMGVSPVHRRASQANSNRLRWRDCARAARPCHFLALAIAFAAVLCVVTLAPAQPAPRPNVLIILADDMGFWLGASPSMSTNGSDHGAASHAASSSLPSITIGVA